MEDRYAIELLKKLKEVEQGLQYYTSKTSKLENELKAYKEIYENRVNEFLKVKGE